MVETAAAAAIVRLEPGLSAVAIGAVAVASPAGLGLPRVLVSRFPEPGGEVEIFGESGSGEAWLGGGGGVVVARASPSGGAILIAALAPAASRPVLPGITVHRLGGEPAAALPAAATSAPAAPPAIARRAIPAELLLHVERIGDCRFPAEGWVGPQGRGLRVEGFAINPLAALSPGDIEYKGFHPGGGETPWVRGPQFCGSRQRRLALTGFAVRPAAPLGRGFTVVYSGAFRSGAIVGPCRDGEPCRAPRPDDPLEALSISIETPAV